MDFHELEAFLALAETLHFARAAAQVHMSPSALSRLLGRLEEKKNSTFRYSNATRAVSRLRKKALPSCNSRGRQFTRRDDLLLQIGERDDRLRGILRIYASVTACYSDSSAFRGNTVARTPGATPFRRKRAIRPMPPTLSGKAV